MSVPYAVLGALVVMAVVASIVAAGPTTDGARRRRLARRRQWVAEHPGAARSHDVVELLRRSGLLTGEARSLTETAADRGVRAATLYRWLDRLDDDVRVSMLRAGLSDAQLVRHVGQGTLPDVPDVPGVREFAADHGLAVAPVDAGGSAPSRSTPPAPPQDLAADGMPESPTVETLVAEPPAVVVVQDPPAPVVVPSAVTDARPAAAATLLGSSLGTRAPVP